MITNIFDLFSIYLIIILPLLILIIGFYVLITNIKNTITTIPNIIIGSNKKDSISSSLSLLIKLINVLLHID